MAGDDDFGAGNGQWALRTLKEYGVELLRQEKRKEKERDRLLADQIGEIIFQLIRVDDAERRRFLSEIRAIPLIDQVLDRIAEKAIGRLRIVRNKDLRRGVVSTMVEIGPRVLHVVGRSWQSTPNELHAVGVVDVIEQLVGKMDLGESQCALEQLELAGEWLDAAVKSEGVARVKLLVRQKM